MAAQFWARRGAAVGRRLHEVEGRWRARWSASPGLRSITGPAFETPRPVFFYVALRQNSQRPTTASCSCERRQSGRAGAMRRWVAQIHALDANVAPSELITRASRLERTTWRPSRFRRPMLVAFGGCSR